MFMHGLNPQLHQLVETMVISGDLEEVIEIMKKAIVYSEDKGGSSQTKTENTPKRQNGGKGGKGKKGNWYPSAGPKRKVQVFIGDSHPEVVAKIVMVVTEVPPQVGEKGHNPTIRVRGPKVNQERSPL